jgi:uncharacterized protein RhaS with RHS repeats
VGGINTYAYVRNNPLHYTDPSGLNPVAGAIEGAEIGTVTCGPYCGVAGAIIGGVVGSAIGDAISDVISSVMESRSRGNNDGEASDPDSTKGLVPINPGRDCNGNCKPCPPNQVWQHSGNAHGSTNGIHYHGIVWNQNPSTCECFPTRVSGPTSESMK